jgi:Raf kinase inhibitor-like YbhB/YbcL family protein
MQEIKVTSSAFANNGRIPAKYTCDSPDAEVSPPLQISDVPEGAKTLALVMHDPDAPRAGGWTHWVKFNIPWNIKYGTWSIKEGEEPQGVSGKGTGGNSSYMGPCPPSGTHRYFFTVYALDTGLSLNEGAAKDELESAMRGHILGKGELVGLYSRKR